MPRLVFAVLVLVLGLATASAEAPPALAPGVPSGSGTLPVAVYGADGKIVSFPDPARIMVTTMPLTRLHRDPIRLKNLTQTPKVFDVRALRPSNATTYRIVIPCEENVRLLGTADPTETLTDDMGVLYLRGTDVVMGTSRPDYIIAKTMTPPAAECTPEMHYGMGGG